jgi:hypothetical protein
MTLLLAATGVSAQPRQEQSTDVGGQVTGEIIAIDNAAKTLSVKGANNDGGTYMTNSYTTIMNGDKTVGLSDLKKGWHVAVTSDKKDGKNVAQYITVVDTGN